MRWLLFLASILACVPAQTDTAADAARGDTEAQETALPEDSAPPDTSEGEYFGTIEGVNTANGNELLCSGDATLSIDATGQLRGYLSCNFDALGFAQEGEWIGNEFSNTVESTWLVEFGSGEPTELVGPGTYQDGTVRVDFEYHSTVATFAGTATLTRNTYP